MRVRDRTRDPLSPYSDLIDMCRAKGFRVHLDWGAEGWTLDVFDLRRELVARGTSTRPVPECFRELAAHACAGIARSGA